MGSDDRDGNRLIKANFTNEGAAKLKERVMAKLKEFMGEYSDDYLVDYVIVLLKNGKRKEQAKNDLKVFLGENSDSFISWLWDHLHLYLDSYVYPPESVPDEASIRKIISEVQGGDNDSQHLNSQSERGSSKLARSRHNKDWKGLIRGVAEPPPIRSSVIDNAHQEEKIRPEANHCPRSISPKSPVQRKRGRADEQQRTKRDVVSQVNIAAPRRLLQFAVRDAVGTSRTANSSMSVEPSAKRLRSVVSTSAGESSLVECPQRMQLASRVANPMATVIKAVAEAAEDVIKSKPSGSVFDRLSRGMDTSDDYQHQEQNLLSYSQKTDYKGQYAANIAMMGHETGYPSDSNSDYEAFDDVNVLGRRVSGASQMSPSVGNRGNDSLMVQYRVAKNIDDSLRLKRNREQDQLAASPNTSHKILNISVNVNTWKPLQHQEPREVAEIDGNKTFYNKRDPRSRLQLVKENGNTLKVSNGNANPACDVLKESSKAHVTASGSNTAGRPLEDVDCRTIFLSNVHFAATKDGLSRHFNRFGEILKVIIVTDAATGQPKGAAYVEFMRKEAAESALSLDGTSFMSRILKVIKKSAAHQESAPAMPWPRIVRGSPFPSARFSRHPFPRGVPGAFRLRPPMKLGARSLKWKRDAQGSDNSSSVNTGSAAAPLSRGFTYVRTESKPEGSLGTT